MNGSDLGSVVFTVWATLGILALAVLAATTLWPRATRPRHPSPKPACTCGHAWDWHTHYRPGSDCGSATCGCRRYQPAKHPAPSSSEAPGTTPPAAGQATPPAEGARPRATRPPGQHYPHTPNHPGWRVEGKPCGCWVKTDNLTGRELGRRVCQQAPTWEQWEKELSQ